ncbi:heme exporter protein CcmD [Rhodocyclus tenuis]|uniref:heme exporter protein CcmD n=1 Tax=Rhodocyclus gracilis TaxID=2929842 RepID=UPI001298D32E|nr:heme exporter protein CcmD [Rhodocyclus gracilis]MRD72150.1 heme exporter protein CcmD [Rhodocyclus gracilis]
MVWNSFSEFLAMGGYGLYVWGSVAATALVMALEPVLLARRQRTLIAQIRRQLAADGRSAGQAPRSRA